MGAVRKEGGEGEGASSAVKGVEAKGRKHGTVKDRDMIPQSGVSSNSALFIFFKGDVSLQRILFVNQ